MAQQTINVGAAPNDGTGTPLRTAFQYTNSNFSELYTALGGGSGLPGASTQVLFNNGTNIAGDAGLVYNSTTDALTIGGNVQAASATITGDLTVATSGLKIDSATGRSAFNASTYASSIGVMQSSASYYAGLTLRNSAGTYSGSIGLDASGSGGGSQDVSLVAVGTNLSLYSGNNLQYKIAHPGVFTWYDGAGGTRMTLNATGLGVGASPSYQLHVSKSQASATTLFVDNQQNNAAASSDLSLSAYGGNWNLSVPHSATFVNPLIFKFGSTERMRITSDGNVGIGVTPSAWAIGKIIQLSSASGSFLYGAGGQAIFGVNAYYDTAWKYGGTGFANYYQQSSGIHSWFTAPSGTAGNAITWTQAMTLDASGNLLVGTTSGSYRGQFAVASGADRNIFTAQVTGASNGLQVQWNHATTTLRINVSNLPTSSAGLPVGTLWIDTTAGNTLKVA